MNFRFYFIIFSISVECEKEFHKVFTIQKNIDQSAILSELIANYLIKYFDDEENFISIIIASSEVDQRYFQHNSLDLLFSQPKIREFSHNILSTIEISNRTERNIFNLIFVEGSKCLL